MKRFYKDVAVAAEAGGFRVTLDGRGIRTVAGKPQIVPTRALADALAAEWAAQGEEIDAASFLLRDMADYALDVVAPERAQAITELLPYGETDTLCYRAEPDEALGRRQHAVWEPLLVTAEERHGVRFVRVAGVMHRPQPEPTLARVREVLESLDAFALAALRNTAGLAASLMLGLAALEPGADIDALWDAANLEEDWQAELWGKDAEALERRERRHAAFAAAAHFAALAR
ncbi:molecular chaperone [Novosphingobium sp. KCTC 2891]|uniref:ATP12 family chaperone protein n=1 Tax=Novosphingobium sp. KCTC 2891 TaxID=2989730 RepID=UPI002222E5ED|nr:ATP12 family protein [Novosphingobium sp. KCTC 2891]MCW1383958.1 molecular chaperone [Novosphingobium sp. KCTC 2891]